VNSGGVAVVIPEEAFSIHQLRLLFTSMFCPSCGTESTGLKYCNRCGANLAALGTPPEIIQVNLTKPAVLIGIIMTLLTLGGFTLLIIGARLLASVMHGDDPLMGLIIMGMIVILVIDIILGRQLTKLINAALRGSSQQTFAAPNPPAQLSHPAQQFVPAGSVTENTTRFFEGSYRGTSEISPTRNE
jgi:hypothetical protein